MSSQSKVVHIIYIPFRDVGVYDDHRGDEWLKYRINIFQTYTLKSLTNQNDRNFIVWCSFRPDDQGNPLVDELRSVIINNGIRTVFTYDGLMYWDDKFSYSPLVLAKNVLRVLRGALRGRSGERILPSLKQLFRNKNSTLKRRVASSLTNLRNHVVDKDWVLLTRIDSDDMFHSGAIEEIKRMFNEEQIGGKALVFWKGYIYNEQTDELAYYHPETHPPFHTITFPKYSFIDPMKHIACYKDFKSHEDIPKVFREMRLSDYKYMVLVHNIKNQISTTWNHLFRKKKITGDTKRTILQDFGWRQ